MYDRQCDYTFFIKINSPKLKYSLFKALTSPRFLCPNPL